MDSKGGLRHFSPSWIHSQFSWFIFRQILPYFYSPKPSFVFNSDCLLCRIVWREWELYRITVLSLLVYFLDDIFGFVTQLMDLFLLTSRAFWPNPFSRVFLYKFYIQRCCWIYRGKDHHKVNLCKYGPGSLTCFWWWWWWWGVLKTHLSQVQITWKLKWLMFGGLL